LLQYTCNSIDWLEDEEQGTLSFVLHIPEAAESMEKLLDSATMLDLSFDGGHNEYGSFLSFILRSGNGELAVLIPKTEWPRFLEEPDRMILDYGKRFEMDFLPLGLLKFIDQKIELVNEGKDSPFLKDIIEVFAEIDS